MEGYLLVKKALRSLSSEVATPLGYPANAVVGAESWFNSRVEYDSMIGLANAVKDLNKGGVPFAVGGRVELSDNDRSASLTILKSAQNTTLVRTRNPESWTGSSRVLSVLWSNPQPSLVLGFRVQTPNPKHNTPHPEPQLSNPRPGCWSS